MRPLFLVLSYLSSLHRQHIFSKVIQVNIFKSVCCVVVDTKFHANYIPSPQKQISLLFPHFTDFN